MLNALIVVWRESLEALLIISVLLAWVNRQPSPAPLRRSVFKGALAGFAVAVALAFATLFGQSQLTAAALEIFQLGMVMLAAALLFHMALWMRRHGGSMGKTLQARAGRAEQTPGSFSMGTITALAVAREGAETVIFVLGLDAQSDAKEHGYLLASVAAGMALAAVTAALVHRGARAVPMKQLFRISEVAMLLISGAMLVNGIDRMISLDWLDFWLAPLWDSSAWLDDTQGVGNLLANFVGYRAQPCALVLAIAGSFWLIAVWQFWPKRAAASGAAPTPPAALP